MRNQELLNRVLHGDCLEWMPQIEDSSIDICISDIPYGINYDDWDVLHKNTNSALGKNHKSMENTSFKKRGKPINGWNETDKKISYEYQEWCREWVRELYRVTKEASPIILFSSRRYLHRVCSALEDEGFLIRDILIWEKDKANGRAQRINNVLHKRGIYEEIYNDYRIGNLKPQYEPVIWAMKPYSHTLTDCVLENQIGGINCENNKLPSNIIKCPTNKKNMYHPTEKPIELMNKILSLFSISENHVILDMFSGSGTTLVSCIGKNRNFIGIEKDWDYCMIANERIKQAELQSQVKE